MGRNALDANTTGVVNTAVGSNALGANTTASNNTAVGGNTLLNNTASNNVAVGSVVLNANTTGAGNTAVGTFAMGDNTTGANNTALGFEALTNNSTGNGNTAIGNGALLGLALLGGTGSGNIALGSGAGFSLNSGDNNIYIGSGISTPSSESGTIRVGVSPTHTRAFVHGIRGVTTGVADAVAVLIDSQGQLGTVSSTRRVKEDIGDMGEVSQRLLNLRPVVFRYKQAAADGSKPLQYGLIAEEVAEVMPELVVYDAEGQPQTVQYHVLPALLLNELQRQHVRAQRQEAELVELRELLRTQTAELAELKAMLRGQAERASR
jgi:hypothetical protein